MPLLPPAELATLLRLARDAGREIMAVYASEFAVRDKTDLSPVTEADAVAERVILVGLAQAFPAIPVIAEEQSAQGVMPETGDDFFLVDPLDGTKEFISRNGEFTVNIAHISRGVPVAGVVYAPATGLMFWGQAGLGAFSAVVQVGESTRNVDWQAIRVRPQPAEGLVVVASRSHRDAETEAYLAGLRVSKLVSAGSSLKFCKIACGEADLYPRFGRTMEWDTAAGQAVLEAAGGHVVDTAGLPLRYGKRQRGFDNPGFVATAA